MNEALAETAALFSDPGRAAMLTALLGGIALPAGELALVANVAPQTASGHLSKLVSGKLLAVEQQGRHRYYRLADAEVAHAIEALLAVSPDHQTHPNIPTRSAGTLAYARSCYSHLAGSVAVQIADAMLKRGITEQRSDKFYAITKRGIDWFGQLGIAISDRDRADPRFVRGCLDWTERRHHLAGRLGSTMFTRLRELRWIAPVRGSRAVRVTLEGQQKLQQLLGIR